MDHVPGSTSPRRTLSMIFTAIAAALAATFTVPIPAAATEPTVPINLALTPPMGWNSWNQFNCTINEDLIKETADAIVARGLENAGYEYVNIDDCWQASTRDAEGRLQANPELVSTVSAKSRSGTMRKPECWPDQPPPCWMRPTSSAARPWSCP